MKKEDIWKYVSREIWGEAGPISWKGKWYCPQKRGTVWMADGQEEEKYINQEQVAEGYKKDSWMRPYTKLESMEEILKKWAGINYAVASRQVNSVEVEESDEVYNSRGVYASSSIFDSKNIVGSRKLFDCGYLVGCRDDSACSIGTGVRESIYCTRCWEVSWSNKVSRSAFVHDGYDVSECLFCSHLRSKKYCVANIQLEKEEYLRVKEMVKGWVISGGT